MSKRTKHSKQNAMRVEPLYTVQEVAEKRLLGLAQRSLRQRIKEGKLRVRRIKMEGMKKPRVFIPESAIKEYLEKYTEPYEG